ncbi:MAG: flagellar biosynthetic protein FliQ [Myxococcales bacterium]|nr:flagellar biosynthetic protein FliQ [Myxococcales bacterium]
MSDGVVALVQQALVLAASLAVPALAGAFVAGALAGLLQNLLAWQDAALGQVLRLVGVSAAWAVAWPWVSAEVLAFARLAWGGG